MTATPPELPQPGDTVAGKYRIERVLGTGGMGAVYEATHQVTGKRFAVKWLLPDLSNQVDAVRRFIREAQVAGRFEHANVVEVYDVGQEHGSFFMVMELLHGESLGQRLRTRGVLSAEEACTLLIPCMRGVARAHQAGIVHRDLKPDNIFVCRDRGHGDHPKVLDFGISKMANAAGDVNPSITKTGIVMGTPHYMAPEQLRGKGMDHRVDVYAFGVILYQLLSGWLPFPGDTYSELVLKIATEQPIPLSEHAPTLPQALIDIVSRAMARDPAARFQTLEELADALIPYSGGQVTRAPMMPSSSSSHASSPSGGHVRKATPSSGTVRLETPLATQSHPMPMQPQRTERSLVLVGLLVVAALVVALVVVAVVLLNRDPAVASDVAPGQSAAAAALPAAGKAPQAETAPAEQEPVVNTVRIAEDSPAPERHWEPPAADARREPPVAAKLEPQRNEQSNSGSTTKKGKRKPREPSSPPAPPMPTTTVQQEPSMPPKVPSTNKPSPGRLGVQMEEGEF